MSGAAQALSPRPFTVTMRPPEPFSWEKIVEPLYKELKSQGMDDQTYTMVVKHYSHLIRLKSWEKGIDWVTHSNQITLVVPNDLNRQQKWDDKNKHYTDGLSVLLSEILASITLEMLLNHFAKE